MKRRAFLTGATGIGATTAMASEVGAHTATPTPTPTPTPGGNTTATPGGGGSGSGTTHTVDMTDQLVFAPESITIAPGDTVEWVNVGSVGHSVTAYEDDIPEGATYFASGGLESEQAARDAYSSQGDIPGGESYSHTFETPGTYEYFCIPHEQVGMVGTVEVVEGGGGGGPGGGHGGGEEDPHEMGVPFQAHFVGIATILGLVVSLVFTFFVLKYGESPNTKGGN